MRLSDFPDALRVAFDSTLVIDDVTRSERLSEMDRQSLGGLGMGALVAATLRKGEHRPLWSIVAVSASPRPWTSGEIALIEEVTERTWAASQRAHAENARRDFEERFRAVANLVPDLLWEGEPDGVTTWYNQRWLDYTGQTFEQETGWGWTDAIHPEDQEASAHRYQGAIETGQSLRQEHRIRRQDGEYRWFAVDTFPLVDDHGRVVKIYGAATDIHDLRTLNATLEEQVTERTQRLAEVAEQLQQQNLELAARTRVLQAFSQLTRNLTLETDRYTLVRHVQNTLLKLLPPAHTGYFELEADLWRMKSEAGDVKDEALRAVLKAGIPKESPGPFTPFSTGQPKYQDAFVPGQDTPAELSQHIQTTAALPILLNGVPIGVLAVARFDDHPWQPVDKIVLETTAQTLSLALERVEAVQALVEEREALATFVRFTESTAETSDVGLLAQRATEVLHATLNIQSAVYFEQEGDLWKVRHVSGAPSPQLEQCLRAGLPLRAPSFALPTERRELMFFEPWDAAADGFSEAAYQVVARYPLFPQDAPVGMLGMASSVAPAWTEREKAVFRAVGDSLRLALERAARVQQVERQRERLADINNELGNFITRTAHNLEEPARQLSHLLDPGRPQDAELPFYDPVALKEEVTRLKGVAHDLRQLSRLEGHPLSKELLPLGELFTEISTTPPGGRVTWQVDPLPIVRGDRVLLRQALQVLLTFTLSESRGTRYVMVSSQEVEGEVHVTVEDDGLGLTGEEAATLFDLAVRTNQEVPLLQGSGLVQVRRVLARHGGWAWAESQRSSGKVVLAFPKDEVVNQFEALFQQDRSDG